MSGDQLNLDAIEAKARRLAIVARNLSQRELFEDDVPALVAEVRRLREELDAEYAHRDEEYAARNERP